MCQENLEPGRERPGEPVSGHWLACFYFDRTDKGMTVLRSRGSGRDTYSI